MIGRGFSGTVASNLWFPLSPSVARSAAVAMVLFSGVGCVLPRGSKPGGGLSASCRIVQLDPDALMRFGTNADADDCTRADLISAWGERHVAWLPDFEPVDAAGRGSSDSQAWFYHFDAASIDPATLVLAAIPELGAVPITTNGPSGILLPGPGELTTSAATPSWGLTVHRPARLELPPWPCTEGIDARFPAPAWWAPPLGSARDVAWATNPEPAWAEGSYIYAAGAFVATDGLETWVHAWKYQWFNVHDGCVG